MELALGAASVVAACLAMWLALPRDGQVRWFLRNDQVQAYYAVVVLGAFALGLVNLTRGLLGAVGLL